MKNKKIIILVVIILLLILVAILLLKKNNKSEDDTNSNVENAITTYIEAFNNGDVEALKNAINIRAACIWSGDISTFMDDYNNVTDEEVSAYEAYLEVLIDNLNSSREEISGYTMELVSIDSYENLEVDNLIKARVKIKTSYSNDEGTAEPETDEYYYYIYENKVVTAEVISENTENAE